MATPRVIAKTGLEMEDAVVWASNNKAGVDSHLANTANPHSVNATDVGLGSVDDTADTAKPISTATQTALDGKVDDAQVLTNVPGGAVFTDTVYDDSTTLVDSDALSPVNAGNKLITESDVTGGGDMLKATYDTGNNGVVDNAELVNSLTVETAVPVGALFTDTNTTDHTLLSNIGTNTHTQVDTHIANTANPHSVDATDVGLGSVDNTTDSAKPISTATQTALDGKEDDLSNPTSDGDILSSTIAGTRSWITPSGTGDMTKAVYDTGSNGVVDNAELVNSLTVETAVPAGALFTDTTDHTALSNIGTNTHAQIDTHIANVTTNPHAVDKSDVGLSNVDDTADTAKPVSTATQTALDGKEDSLGDPSSDGDYLISGTNGARAWQTPIDSTDYYTKAEVDALLDDKVGNVTGEAGTSKVLFDVAISLADYNSLVAGPGLTSGAKYTIIN